VWDNPVLWRETCTWAYGRKVLIVKVGYLFVAAAAVLGLNQAIATASAEASVALLPAPTLPMALFFLISLVMVNALAVTSITSERDGQALDLLLVTDISPREFVLGKLLGVLWVTREMVLLPLALCGYLWWREGITGENLAFILIGLAVMNVFVAMLGIHCGMSYANSRSAIGISLGVVFFLFLGIGICMAIMVFFSGSFQIQLAPFVAFVLGGGVGLLVALGHRNASKAIHIAAFGLPLATFYAITSFVLRNQELWVFLVSIVAYGFTTAAMMVPAIGAFDIAMGRTKTAEDE
jgi:ABC-type transport system involved in multi-copper enzyme maturation permease subunit